MDLPKQCPPTPPHHPVYGIRLQTAHIQTILHHYDNNLELVSKEELSSARSWNNRLYFLVVRKPSKSREVQELVLKVNGRFFGLEKVENEVACLSMLRSYCPEVPAPRALAWSRNGNGTAVTTEGKLKQFNTNIQYENWILMTRVPGQPIELPSLSERDTCRLAEELANLVTTWRRKMPPQKLCGNLRYHEPDFTGSLPDIYIANEGRSGPPIDLVVRGVMGDNIHESSGIWSLEHYYRVKLQDKIDRLKTEATYRTNNYLIERLDILLSKLRSVRPLLAGDDQASEFVFTHYDLSPRNVLVTGSPPKISGIVDYEFAGFFSPMEEFLNDHVNNKDDWTTPFYDAYLRRLESNGVPTPTHGMAEQAWQQALWLEQLIQNIAPWWLPGKYTKEQCEAELAKSGKLVQEILDKLG